MTHVFRHPKFYRIPRDKSNQAISLRSHDGERERAPGSGHKQQATSKQEGASNQQSTSSKAQATSLKP